MEKENIKTFLKSKATSHVMTAIVILAGVIIIFHAGEEFGYKKAEVMEHMSGNYYKTFGPGDPRRQGPMSYLFDDQTASHGVAGKIISASPEKIIVEDNQDIEKVVLVDKNTIIHKQRSVITTNDLKIDDFVVVIGSPNSDGQITAKIIND